MDLIINSVAILTALLLGIFLGAKTDAKNALTSGAKSVIAKLRSNKAVIISPLKIFKREQIKKELSDDKL